jgi:hypothetical protein
MTTLRCWLTTCSVLQLRRQLALWHRFTAALVLTCCSGVDGLAGLQLEAW